jgi:uncharacterized membrane protein
MNPESTRNFESNRILAGVGALLVAVGSFIPFAGPIGIIAIVGIILVLIGMRGIADDFKDYSIFRNTLYGFLSEIVAICLGIAAFASLFLGMISGFPFFSRTNLGLNFLLVIVFLIFVFVFFLVGAVFFRQAFSALADKSGVGMFRTGGMMLLIGAALIIAFGLGFILLFVAWILLAVGFFSMRPPTQPAPAYAAPFMQPAASASASGQMKYCSYCGAENRIDGTFCTHCGRRL